MRFSTREVRDLFFAWILLSVAFTILFTNFSDLLVANILMFFMVSLITVGLGFLLHELAHKFVAQGYGLWAEFKASYGMLMVAIGLSFLGFIFAAPGGVYIHGLITKEKNGKISLAGPVTNIILAGLFLVPLLLLNSTGIAQLIFSYGFRISALLALFNMIPVMPLDGAKVLAWSKKAYWTTITISALLFIGSFFI